MEYCDCGSLRSYLDKSQQAFSEAITASICHQILQGLSYLHEKGIIHRDLKSANILWKSGGEIRLADLGEGVQLNGEKQFVDDLLGTPLFMAPEVARGERYSFPVDIWSLGITAVELAEIRPPFWDMNPMAVKFYFNFQAFFFFVILDSIRQFISLEQDLKNKDLLIQKNFLLLFKISFQNV